MKQFLTTLFTLFLFADVQAQENQQPSKDTIINGQRVFLQCEKMPEFPGGETKLMKFLQKNINYPADSRIKNVMGTVYTAFLVDTTGKIFDVNVLKGVAKDLDAEAIRVINAMPKWSPGMENGKAVVVLYYLPIRFSLKQ